MGDFSFHLGLAREAAVIGLQMSERQSDTKDIELQRKKLQLIRQLEEEFAANQKDILHFVELAKSRPDSALDFYHRVVSHQVEARIWPLLSEYHADLQSKITGEGEQVNQRLQGFERVILLLIGVGGAGGIFLAVVMSRSLTRPLAVLKQAVEEAGKGNLDITVPVQGQDELSQLVRSFNKMSEDLKRLSEQQRQTMAALEESEERLRYLLCASPIVIYTCEPLGEHRFTFVSDNVTEKLGYQPKDLLENPGFWKEHLHPEDVPSLSAAYPTLLAQGRQQQEYRFRRPDGAYIWLHDEVKLTLDEKGQPQELIGSWIDISERKNMEDQLRELTYSLEERIKERTWELSQTNEALRRELQVRQRLEDNQARLIQQLEHSNRELNDFAYLVSHDLKAPLRAIATLADWLASDYEERLDEAGKENLALLIQRVRRMNDLIEGILQYSRVGRVREEMAEIDTQELVQEVIDLLSIPDQVTVTVVEPPAEEPQPPGSVP